MKLNSLKRIISIVAVAALLCLMAGCTTTGAASGDASGSTLMTMLPMLALVVIFYFFLIRPENKKKKELSKMRDALSVGDTITTIGGMIGKVVQIKDDLITFETGEDRVRVQIAKWGISTTGKADSQQNSK